MLGEARDLLPAVLRIKHALDQCTRPKQPCKQVAASLSSLESCGLSLGLELATLLQLPASLRMTW